MSDETAHASGAGRVSVKRELCYIGQLHLEDLEFLVVAGVEALVSSALEELDVVHVWFSDGRWAGCCAVDTDQRGEPRPVVIVGPESCDVWAVEVQLP